MATMDPEIKSAVDKYKLPSDACWLHKQSGKYILSHWACEHIAVVDGVVFSPPTIVCADPANKIATLCVTGTLGKRVEWSFGEAAPYNTTQAYPFAMAEKRAKDRVLLKLIGLAGKVYSEEESESFEKPSKALPATEKAMRPVSKGEWSGPRNESTLKREMHEFARDLEACSDSDELEALIASKEELLEQCRKDWPACWLGEADHRGAKKRIEERRIDLNPANLINAA